MHTGSCLCGAVRYEVDGDIRNVTHCHCSMCRKAHGSAFGSYGSVRREQFRFLQGEEHLVPYESSEGVRRRFCSACGASLLWLSEHRFPEWVSFALGTLDTPFVPPKQRHIHVASKAEWHEVTDAWPQQPD
ncbi:MAG: GFA family protein [Pedobacter sp.]|nr:GFA family protein [Pedobacter sp.]